MGLDMSVTFQPIVTRDEQAARPTASQRTVEPQSIRQGFASIMDQIRRQETGTTAASKEGLSQANPRAEIHAAVLEASQEHGVDAKLLLAVIKQESGFNPKARSHCGAQGLMQLMPETARVLGVKDSYNIRQNIDGGTRYLRQLLDQFGGDVKLALAGYNAGPHRVVQYGGIPPFEETQNYVKAITGDYQGLHHARSSDLAFAMATPQLDLLDLSPIKFATEKSEPPPEPPFPGYQKV